MVRTQLISLLAAQHPKLSAREIESIITAFFEEITEHLVNGGRVDLRGFGSFSTRDRAAYTGRNPQTGEVVEIDANRVPHFAPGKELRRLAAASKVQAHTRPTGIRRNAATKAQPAPDIIIEHQHKGDAKD
jgi:integration host factor subunit beta